MRAKVLITLRVTAVAKSVFAETIGVCKPNRFASSLCAYAVGAKRPKDWKSIVDAADGTAVGS